MADPKIANTKPAVLDLEPGQYYWCSCGESQNQPFCDGSHQGTDFGPQVVQIEEARKAAEDATAENAKIVDAAREEARKVINEGHRVVSDMKKEARESSQREAEALVTRAREDIDRELQKSLTDLKGTVANLSVRISRQIIQDELDEKRHEELAEEFVERLRRSHASRRS